MDILETLTSQNYWYTLDSNRQAQKVVKPKEVVKIDTMNAFGADLENESDLIEALKTGYHHPVSGPIYCEGAIPGHTLMIRIEDIELNEYAYQCISRSTGVLRGQFQDRNFKKIRVDRESIYYDQLILPTKPIVGVIGLGNSENTRSGRIGKYGGNMDLKEVGVGSTIFLPIEAEGGLLYLGDLHANQGVGELSGIALEASGSVTISMDIVPCQIPGPIIVSDDKVLIVGYGETILESTAQGVSNMLELLTSSLHIDPINAYMLGGAIGDIVIGHMTGKVVSTAIKLDRSILNFPDCLLGG